MKVFLRICCGLLLWVGTFLPSHSQTAGPANPSAESDGGGGSGGVPTWTFGGGTAFSSNDAYAQYVSFPKNKNSNYLHVTGFGFAIPAGSYISGITVAVEMYGTGPAGGIITEESIMLINSASARVGTDQSTFAAVALGFDPNTYTTYGGSSDNWGGGLTYLDINSANFGVALQYRTSNTNPTDFNLFVDHVRVTITYSPGFDAVVDGCFNDGATWGRVSPGVAGIDYPDATIAASIPGGTMVTVCSGSTANCFALIINSDASPTNAAALNLADATATLNVANDILMLTSTAASANIPSVINIAGGTISVTRNLSMTGDRNPPFNTTQTINFTGGSLTVNGNVTMLSDNAAATTTLNMSTAASVFNLGGNLSLGTGASVSNGTGATGTINYNGAGSQIVRSAVTYFDLTFSGGGTKNLEAATLVKGTLNLVSGDCNLGVQTLTLGASTAAIGSLTRTSGTLYNGTFLRWFNTSTIAEGANAGLFPVGTSIDYRPFYVYYATGPSAGGTLSMSHTDPGTGASAVSFVDNPTATLVVRRTNMNWFLTAANAFSIGAGNLSARAEGTNIGTISLVSDLRLTLVGSTIGDDGVSGGVPALPIVRRTGLPAFTAASNTFYIGSVDAISSPLPITLIDFTAAVVDNGVQLKWNTASEVNNDFFTVERTGDAETFEDVAMVNGGGTTTSANTYSAIDYRPLTGKSYYRLKQVDFDGTFTYSKLVAVDVAESLYWSVYPNPSNGSEVSIGLSFSDVGKNVSLKIQDINGKEMLVMSTERLENPEMKVEFPQNLAPGMYIISIAADQQVSRKKLIVR